MAASGRLPFRQPVSWRLELCTRYAAKKWAGEKNKASSHPLSHVELLHADIFDGISWRYDEKKR